MTRIGKIARLPRLIRDQLNHRLQDGESGQSLVTWLNAQPEVLKVLADSFGGRPVNAQNLTDWKQGGYQDWLARQDTLELARQMGEQATDLQTGDPRPLTDLLAVLLTARYATAIKDFPPPTDEAGLKRLHGLCADIVSLRWGDHSAARLRLERERFDLQRESTRQKTEEEMLAWAKQDENAWKICEDYVTPELQAMQLEAVRWRVFGKAVWGNSDLEPPPGWDGHMRDPERPGPTPKSVIRDRALIFPPEDTPVQPAPPEPEPEPEEDEPAEDDVTGEQRDESTVATESEPEPGESPEEESNEPSPEPETATPGTRGGSAPAGADNRAIPSPNDPAATSDSTIQGHSSPIKLPPPPVTSSRPKPADRLINRKHGG